MAITLKQLDAFHAVMSSGSVTRASEALGVSQPAISRMIADLELSVGIPLFQRTSRTLVPTSQARTLHAEVGRVFLGLNHIEAIAAGLREGGEGQLRLGVVPSLLPTISAKLIAPFSRLHPTASISIEVVATLNTLDWLSFRQTDLGITFEPMSSPGLETRKIGQVEAVCVVPAGHRLAKLGRPVGTGDLNGETFISYKPDSAFRAEVDRLFEDRNVSRNLRFEARTTSAVCELVAALGGVSVVPSSGPHLTSDSRLAVLPFAPSLGSDIVIVRPSLGSLSPLADDFIRFAAAQQIDLTEGQ